MAEQAINQILKASTIITNIVGSNIAPSQQIQEAELPFITYSVTGYEPTLTHSGAIVGAKTIVQVDAYAETYKEATILQLKIRQALTIHKGLAGTINVRNITTDGKTSLNNVGPETYAVSSEYTILHTE